MGATESCFANKSEAHDDVEEVFQDSVRSRDHLLKKLNIDTSQINAMVNAHTTSSSTSDLSNDTGARLKPSQELLELVQSPKYFKYKHGAHAADNRYNLICWAQNYKLHLTLKYYS